MTSLASPTELAARHRLDRNQNALFAVMRRLASGNRINTGSDDPAGLIASERLRSETRMQSVKIDGYERAYANANIVDGHMSQLSSMMIELESLAVASANTAGMTDAEIQANQQQADALASSIQKFGGDALTSLDSISLPDNGNQAVADAVNSAMAASASVATGGEYALTGGDLEGAQAAIESAMTAVASARGTIGAYQRNTLEPSIRASQIAVENLSAANSRIRDTDYAASESNRIRLEILSETNIRTLLIAQNQASNVLSLLSGPTA
ncbi:MAG: flagellin [Phycisphaerae bacterium]